MQSRGKPGAVEARLGQYKVHCLCARAEPGAVEVQSRDEPGAAEASLGQYKVHCLCARAEPGAVEVSQGQQRRGWGSTRCSACVRGREQATFWSRSKHESARRSHSAATAAGRQLWRREEVTAWKGMAR